MSYFDDNFTGGAKSDDEDTVNDSGSESDDDNEAVELDEDDNLEEEAEEDLEEVEAEAEEDDKGRGYDSPNEPLSDIEEDEEDGDNEVKENEGIVDDGKKGVKRIKKIIKKNVVNKAFIESLSDDDDDEDGDGETYLKKFDKEINDNYIVNNHPECALQNYDEILAMTKVIRDKNNIIIDELHRTIPHLTKYERARILGQRAKQIETGATPFIKVPEDVIDGYLIAVLELQENRIPFIIRRPLPNGGSEYWKISDLENIAF